MKANYYRLTNLPIDSMLGKLYSKGVITLEEKERIESKSIQRDKMICFLDSVIARSLLNNISIKFKGFLEVMEESGDPILTDMAKTLGTYVKCYKCIIMYGSYAYTFNVSL